jgi:acetyl/propionyl-CoA carboxylase alpha subunit
VLRALGDKSAARELARSVGVPVVPGYDGPDDDTSLARAAADIGFPVMVKARGGGGGRGMRQVDDTTDFLEALASARREAEAAFGDARLLLEKLVTHAHHVEVQVLADSHGNFVHLGERDCSVQRRRQKLIEESPSPVVDDALRGRLTDAALRLARAANYVNAGTVEFLVGQPGADGDRPFYFLEVNPRLQVEHPVTEMRTGLDLVELQLRIAAGEPLPFKQEDVKFEGHAIEFRINAEDPWDGFKPSTGRILELYESYWARSDFGFEAGDVVSPHFDSLVGKVIFHCPSRAAVLKKVEEVGLGVVSMADNQASNKALLLQIAENADFVAGRLTIDWMERESSAIRERAEPPAGAFIAAALSTFVPVAASSTALARGFSTRPRESVAAGPRDVWIAHDHQARRVRIDGGSRDGSARVDDHAMTYRVRTDHVVTGGTEFRVAPTVHRQPGVRVSEVVVGPEEGARGWWFDLIPPPPLPRRAQAATAGASVVTAPLAGTIADIRVREGETVEPGQLLLLLEAMKMEHRIVASAAGTVARIAVQAHDVVREGDVLVELQ